MSFATAWPFILVVVVMASTVYVLEILRAAGVL